MCLQSVYSRAEQRGLLKNKADSFYVWKAVEVCGGNLYSGYRGSLFRPGWNLRRCPAVLLGKGTDQYRSGFHSFLNRQSAMRWRRRGERVIRCRVTKSSVIALGEQGGGDVVVTRRMCISIGPTTYKKLAKGQGK